MERFKAHALSRSENPLKKYWSRDMLESMLKGEYETREDDEDYIGDPKWRPWYIIIPRFIMYLILGVLFTVLYPIVYFGMDAVWFIIQFIQRLRKTPKRTGA